MIEHNKSKARAGSTCCFVSREVEVIDAVEEACGPALAGDRMNIHQALQSIARVGFRVGYRVSCRVGFRVGCRVDFRVGFRVGCRVGVRDGCSGFRVGLGFGFRVGFRLWFQGWFQALVSSWF